MIIFNKTSEIEYYKCFDISGLLIEQTRITETSQYEHVMIFVPGYECGLFKYNATP